jgi:hypothetical protein
MIFKYSKRLRFAPSFNYSLRKINHYEKEYCLSFLNIFSVDLSTLKACKSHFYNIFKLASFKEWLPHIL